MHKYLLSFILALALHMAIMGLFVINNISDEAVAVAPKKLPEIISASILDEAMVEAKAKELRQQQADKKRTRQQQKDKLAQQLKQEKQRLQDAKNKRLLEEKLAKKQSRQRQEAAKKEQQKLQLIKQKVALEKKKQQQQKLKRIAVEKQRALEKKQKVAAEEKRKREIAKKELARKEAEQQQKIAAEKKQRENEKRLKIAAAKQAEANRVRAENIKIANKAAADAKALIKRKVTQNWNPPSTVANKLSCKIKVTLIPSGDVMSVTVLKSSGDPLFDASVERAVHKASPLPVPKDPQVFKQFRHFSFVFAPD